MTLYEAIMSFEIDMDMYPLPDKAQLLWHKLLFRAMLEGSNTITVGNETMQKWTGWSVRTIAIARQALVRDGCLEFKKGVRGHPSVYRLLNVPPEGVEVPPLWDTSTI